MHHRHTLLDPIGSLFSTSSTVLYIFVHWLAWPAGLIAICINSYLYYKTGLYADMSLEGFYFVITFYGWYQWCWRGRGKSQLPIKHLTWRTSALLAVLFVVGTFIVHYILLHYTNSKVPYMDAMTSVMSMIAEWMICRKIIENWIIWGVVDAVYASMYYYKGLPAHVIETVLYVGMAVAGYWHWHNKMQGEAVSAPLTQGECS
jgi:nicotinamide mononucleotide transporter